MSIREMFAWRLRTRRHLSSLINFQQCYAFLCLNDGYKFAPKTMKFSSAAMHVGPDDKKEPKGVGALLCKIVHPSKVISFKQHFLEQASEDPHEPNLFSEAKTMTVEGMVRAFMSIVEYWHDAQRKYWRNKQDYEWGMYIKPGGRVE